MQGPAGINAVKAVGYTISIKGGIRGERFTLEYPQPLTPGQVIQLQDDFEWHVVLKVYHSTQGARAIVALPGDSPQAALTEAARQVRQK